MLKEAWRSIYELIRCSRHNVLHLKIFTIKYSRGRWHVRDGDLELVFPVYPYLAFHDIEGYLNEGKWRPEPGMIVLDVGGCHGEFALYAAKRVGPTGRVLMLEPDPENIDIAKKNLALNGNPTNVEIIPSGLWSKSGPISFNAGLSEQSAIAVEGGSPASAGARVVEIWAESLKSLIERYHLDRLDFVKMDIEGAEMEVISSASELPSRYRPRYAIASYHVVGGKKTADMLPAAFATLNYHTKVGYPNHLTTYASPSAID